MGSQGLSAIVRLLILHGLVEGSFVSIFGDRVSLSKCENGAASHRRGRFLTGLWIVLTPFAISVARMNTSNE